MDHTHLCVYFLHFAVYCWCLKVLTRKNFVYIFISFLYIVITIILEYKRAIIHLVGLFIVLPLQWIFQCCRKFFFSFSAHVIISLFLWHPVTFFGPSLFTFLIFWDNLYRKLETIKFSYNNSMNFVPYVGEFCMHHIIQLQGIWSAIWLKTLSISMVHPT